MFSITEGKGFQIKLRNGWTVSCQFGRYNYCDNRDIGGFHEPQVGFCDNAEFWAFRGDEKHGDVRGWQSPQDFVDYINEVSKLK